MWKTPEVGATLSSKTSEDQRCTQKSYESCIQC
jgi:hypothetical protein